MGDTTSARRRGADPTGWAMGADVADALRDVIDARRDIRRYRPDPVPEELLTAVLEAGHHAPSVGHSQPWRFMVVRDQATRDRAAHLADRARLAQASDLTQDRAARLLDLKLEGLREAPVGIVVACDRRTPAAGVLGRATFPDTDLWSCATAIENMWLTARAHGLGMGWVTLFEPTDLAMLLDLPTGVDTLGWLCLGWPDERPTSPGLERAAWSRRTPLQDIVIHERWPSSGSPDAPVSHVRGPAQDRLVTATDAADELLSPPESLGLLDRVLNRVQALAPGGLSGGTLVLAAADHPVAGLGVSAYPAHVTHDVVSAALAGGSVGAAAATAAGLRLVVVDAGVDGAAITGAVSSRPLDDRGDLCTTDALTAADVERLLEAGRRIGRSAATDGLVVLGEVGVGNTTIAAALVCALIHVDPRDAVGLGAGSDAAIVARKADVVEAALTRARPAIGAAADAPSYALAALRMLGGPELAVLTGVVLGAADAGAPVVLDGLCGSLPGLLAVRLEPSVQAYLVAGQQSRERAHAAVLRELGLEPLLTLRLRAGEGVGGCLAASMLLQGLKIRSLAARTVENVLDPHRSDLEGTPQ
ncbi:5,6-dimethylbenzimidazole synthase [Allobranchiibius huperziae]|uniref:Nicotinate-nucleotide--dimethylbenzimidazole phosphoribosyltransferase n=1 Tax=Allobranchiibius huperziae TaxID=1874116 RepID=A0A853DEF4_9MICO|nr:nicotinate-nucleotide--dimethylbenzimidazole phosphoribosyltransferase [Allobranchiibius huperziae]